MTKNIKALSLSTILVIAITAILTIWSELSSTLKTFLASLTGHHWVTKGVFSIILFVILALILSKTTKESKDIWPMAKLVGWITLLSTLAISLFYVWHFFA